MLWAMKIVSRIVAIIGLLALVVGLVLLGNGTFQVWQQYLAMSADRSKEFINPLPMTLLGTLVIAVGAFLVGLSLYRGVERPAATVERPVPPPAA